MCVCVCACLFVFVCVCVCESVCTFFCFFMHAYGVGSGAADCSWATGFNGPNYMTLDPSSGALFVVNRNTGTVCRVPPGGGAYDQRARKREGSRVTARQG